MAFVATPDCAKVVLVYNMSGQIYANTLWFKRTSTWGTSEMTTLGDEVRYWWATQMQDMYSNDVTLVDIVIYDMTAVDGPVVHDTTDLPIAGSQESDVLAANAASVISFRTSGRGRSARGRIYVGPLTEAASDDGLHLNSTYRTILIAAADAIPAIGDSGGWEHVVVSFQLNGVAREEGYAQPVTTYLVDTALDSQRRRLAGRGT